MILRKPYYFFILGKPISHEKYLINGKQNNTIFIKIFYTLQLIVSRSNIFINDPIKCDIQVQGILRSNHDHLSNQTSRSIKIILYCFKQNLSYFKKILCSAGSLHSITSFVNSNWLIQIFNLSRSTY